MSLNKKTQAAIKKTIKTLESLLNNMHGHHVDYAAMELLEMSISLLERQLDMQVEYILEIGEEEEEEPQFLFLSENAYDDAQNSSQNLMRPLGELKFSEDSGDFSPLSKAEYEFLDEDDDIEVMSAEELEELFNLEPPE